MNKFSPLVSQLIQDITEEKLDDALKVAKQLGEFRILDPACGSGSFLIKCIKWLWRDYQELQQAIQEFIVLAHIFGNDLDKNAVNVAKINIWPKREYDSISNTTQNYEISKITSE